MEKHTKKKDVEMFDVRRYQNWLTGGKHEGVHPSKGVVMPGAAIRLR